jgi:hypothetical protein
MGGRLREAVLAHVGCPLGPVTYVADPSEGAVVLAQRLLTSPQPS